MQDIQTVFLRMQENKGKMKEIKSTMKDAFAVSQGYQDAKDAADRAREKLKEIERSIKDQFGSELTRMEDLKIDIKSDEELLSDIATSMIMKGEAVELKDKSDQEYEPVVVVKFKKMN